MVNVSEVLLPGGAEEERLIGCIKTSAEPWPTEESCSLPRTVIFAEGEEETAGSR